MALVDGISPLAAMGLSFLLAVALAEIAKFRSKADKGFNWIAAGGVWLLFAGTFVSTATLGGFLGSAVWDGLKAIFEIIGWLAALLGTLFVAYQVVIEK